MNTDLCPGKTALLMLQRDSRNLEKYTGSDRATAAVKLPATCFVIYDDYFLRCFFFQALAREQ
ncbi:hypothetical protein ACGVWS_03670 [Enterobacteriaceae bacterium LUAb1]